MCDIGRREGMERMISGSAADDTTSVVSLSRRRRGDPVPGNDPVGVLPFGGCYRAADAVQGDHGRARSAYRDQQASYRLRESSRRTEGCFVETLPPER
jgi:hypothetical protein